MTELERVVTAQRNHIAMALRAFLRLETYSYKTGYSWFEAKMQIIRDAIRHYPLSSRKRVGIFSGYQESGILFSDSSGCVG